MLVYLTNIIYVRDFDSFVKLWLDNDMFKVLFISFELCKFTWIFIFILYQSFNYQILYTFVIFQQMFRLEQLPIERTNYIKNEKGIIKMSKLLYFSIGLAPIPFIILALCELKDVYSIMSIEISVLMLGLNVVMRYNFSQGFWLLQAMYRYHRLEFYQHRKRLIALLVTTFASLFLLFAFAIMGFYLTFCMAEINEIHRGTAVDEAFSESGICSWYANGFYHVLIAETNKK